MKGLKRLFLVCMLMICVVFSLTACDKSSNTNDIKVDNEVHAEESAPPIEYWLERPSEIGSKKSSNNYETPMIFKTARLSMGKFPSHKVQTRLALGTSSAQEKPVVKLKNLNVYKLDKNNSCLYEINISGYYFWWYGMTVEAKTYFYKEGRFVESFLSPHYIKPNLAPYGSIWGTERSNKIGRDGIYVLHIKKATALAEYYEESNQYTFAEDLVFAFQIGNDDFCDNFKG